MAVAENPDSTGPNRRKFIATGIGGAMASALGLKSKAGAQERNWFLYNNRLPHPLTQEERALVEKFVTRDSDGKIVAFGKNGGRVTRENALKELSPTHPHNPEGSNPHPSWCCGDADCRLAISEPLIVGSLVGSAVVILLGPNNPVFAFFPGGPNLRPNEVSKEFLSVPQACITKNLPNASGQEQLGNPYCLWDPTMG